MSAERELPDGCGYQGYEFGGGYLDSQCFGGRLFDMDDCDENGVYEPAEDIPCPMCHPHKAVAYWTERNEAGGSSPVKAKAAAKSLVADIRKNRGVK